MEDQKFDNAKDVLKYLQDQCWKIKKSAFYKHIKEGKLHPDAEGFPVKTVERYAKIFLKRTGATGKTKTDKIISMQERRLHAETRKLESQARQYELKEREAAGKLMSRDQFAMEVCGRYVILKGHIDHFILMRTPELVQICGGDHSKIDETRNFFQEAFDDWMNEFARSIKWEVTYQPNPDNPGDYLATAELIESEELDEDEDY